MFEPNKDKDVFWWLRVYWTNQIRVNQVHLQVYFKYTLILVNLLH